MALDDLKNVTLSAPGCTGADNALSFTCSAAAIEVAAARHAAKNWLRERAAASVAADDLEFDLELVVTELVTNGINAGASTVELRLQAREGAVHVEVLDDAGGFPQARPTPPDAESGRGLHIVGDLSRDWGARTTPDGRTVVWAELRA